MYKIFINENLLILQSKASDTFKSVLYEHKETLSDAFNALWNDEITHLVVYHDDLDGLWIDFYNHFKTIHAAGGVVINPKNEILWIHRLGKWDLPKGKVEIGEEYAQTAIREVEEECGIANIELGDFLTHTYHIYYQKEYILKTTHWYKMFYNGDDVLKPQTEEGIEKVVWFDAKNLTLPKSNTYGTIDLVIGSL